MIKNSLARTLHNYFDLSPVHLTPLASLLSGFNIVNRCTFSQLWALTVCAKLSLSQIHKIVYCREALPSEVRLCLYLAVRFVQQEQRAEHIARQKSHTCPQEDLDLAGQSLFSVYITRLDHPLNLRERNSPI